MANKKIAGVVVLYNPQPEVYEHIKSYINEVDRLFVIDNSEVVNEGVIFRIKTFSNIIYLPQNENTGIAYALNLATRLAIEEGYEYILTMDQDSETPPFMVSNLLECFSRDPAIAIVTPFHHIPYGKESNNYDGKCHRILTTMTSGNLVKLEILKEVGWFDEKLFIDYVDHEFCLRLNKAGYKVYICSKAILKHNLGNINENPFFYKKVFPTNYDSLRHYYQTRNRFIVYKRFKHLYPDFEKMDKKNFRRGLLKVILYERKKIEKLRFAILGYIHFKKNIYGKYKIND